ncbi:MAG: hypothetical protein ACOC6F_01785 [bacterium]
MTEPSPMSVNWNAYDLLAQCAESVYDTRRDLDLEVVVASKTSADGSVDLEPRDCPWGRLSGTADNVGLAGTTTKELLPSRPVP